MSASAILALAFVTGAPTAPSATPDPKLVELVRKLGDKSYRTREDAARELLRRGSDAVAALNEGTKDTDPEVSERCKQLLPQAASLERNEKLAKLTGDPKSPPPKGLAGLDRFLKITGDDKFARELYAELLAVHYRTLEAAEEEPRKAGEQFKQFCDDAYNRWQAGIRTGRYSYDNMFATRADITFFLFLSGDLRVRKNDGGASRASILLNGNQVTKAITEGDSAPAMRKVFLDWLENEPQPHLQQRGFTLASQANLKEALPVALKILDKPGQQTYGKAQVMISLAKLGSKEHIPLLEKYLEDKTNIGSVGFGNGVTMSIQMRDVAMGVSALLSGQKLSDYGFDNRFGGGTPTSYIYFGFPQEMDGKDSKARDEAHSKWKEWASKNLASPKK
jgi:HEAT repeat protein